MKTQRLPFFKKTMFFSLFILLMSFGVKVDAQTQVLRIRVIENNSNVGIQNAQVEVTYNGQTQTKQTNFRGRTGFRVPQNVNATVNVTKDGYEFTPESKTVVMNRRRSLRFRGSENVTPPQNHTINVTVRDRNNNPMAGATVDIIKDNNFLNRQITGNNGIVQATYPNNTNLSVRVSKDGVEFEDPTQNLILSSNRNLIFKERPVTNNAAFTLTPNPVRNGEQLIVNVPTGTLHFNIKDENDNIIRSYGFDPYGGHTQISPTINNVEPGLYKAEIIGENIYEHYGVQELEILEEDNPEDDTRLTIIAQTNTGEPIEGATVTLNNNGQTYELTTDVTGRVSKEFPLNSGIWGTIVKAGIIFENPNISISLNEDTTLTFKEKPDSNFREFVIAPNPISNGQYLNIRRANDTHRGTVREIVMFDQNNNIVKTFDWDRYDGFFSNNFLISGFSPGVYYIRITMWRVPQEIHRLIIR